MQQLTESFVKGVGKTAAAIVVTGVVTGTVMGAMIIYDRKTSHIHTRRKKNSKNSKTQETQTPLEMCTLDEDQQEELSEDIVHEDESKFKKMFDKFS